MFEALTQAELGRSSDLLARRIAREWPACGGQSRKTDVTNLAGPPSGVVELIERPRLARTYRGSMERLFLVLEAIPRPVSVLMCLAWLAFAIWSAANGDLVQTVLAGLIGVGGLAAHAWLLVVGRSDGHRR
jgi:hypothetical protein